MNDPHVERLHYSLTTSEGLSFEKCPPLIHDTETHRFVLEDNQLTCELKEHFAEIEEAKGFVEPQIRSWEIDAALSFGSEQFKFVYKDAHVIDRNPKPDDETSICGRVAVTARLKSSISVHVRLEAYPEPPTDFLINPDVKCLWGRYSSYLQGEEPLLSMAYFCLSLIEVLAGGRKEIPSKYLVDRLVVDKLGELTSTRGDEMTARKAKGHNFTPLTGEEVRWIESCIRKVIRRLGEPAQGVSRHQSITMAELPKI